LLVFVAKGGFFGRWPMILAVCDRVSTFFYFELASGHQPLLCRLTKDNGPARRRQVLGKSRAIDWRSANSRGWLRWRIKPLRLGDAVGLGESDAFFCGAGV
jgi:hypothetical protein